MIKSNGAQQLVNDVPVHYVEYGGGIPVLALHGAYSGHQEIAAFLEPCFRDHPGYRRIYPDSPGVGGTPAPDTINSSDDVLDLMLGLIDGIIGGEAFVLVGHSFGGYLARAITNRRPDQVLGLAAICPLMAIDEGAAVQVPNHVVVHASGDLSGILDPDQESEFRDYFVVQTPETLKRFQEAVLPVKDSLDMPALERMGEQWKFRTAPEEGPAFTKPTLILTGGQDSTVGYVDQWSLLEHYPRATFAVLDRAGHALPHEQVELFNVFMGEWLNRVREYQAEGS